MAQHIDSAASGMRFRVNRPSRGSGAAALLLILTGCAHASGPRAVVIGPAPERQLVERALHYLPSAIEYPVRIIDPDAVPDSEAVRRLDAFIVTEGDGRLRPTIYINRESPMLREALRGTPLFPQMLAAVVVHETAHLSGQTEAGARQAEMDFFSRLVDRGLVPAEAGRQYVARLRHQPPAPGHRFGGGQTPETR